MYVQSGPLWVVRFLSLEAGLGSFLSPFGGHFLGQLRVKSQLSSTSFWQGFTFPFIRAPCAILEVNV